MNRLIDGQHDIKPSDMVFDPKALYSFGDRFGNAETDISAGYIVRMCVARDNTWSPFTRKDIEEFYTQRASRGKYFFNNLLMFGWIQEEDGVYYVTDRFVELAYTPGLWVKG